jgi:type I restriction enzyme S subunit
MPKNWKTYKLDDIAEIVNSKRIPLNSRERSVKQGGIPYYGASGIVDFIDDFIFEGEHVLISEDGENLRSRKTPIAFKADGKFWVNNHAHILKGKEDFLNDWIVYHFANMDASPYLTGAVQPKLNKQSLLSIPMVMPELDEVKAIASILSALDDKIELNLEQNKTLEEMAMALYKHWFVDFGPFKDGKFIDSELGLIPEDWEVKELGDIVEVVNGYAFKSKDFIEEGEKVLKIKNISGNVVHLEGSVSISAVVAEKTNAKFEVHPSKFLVAMTGAEVGKVGIVPDYKQKLWLNQRVGMLANERIKLGEILAGNILQSQEYYEIIQGLAYGSAQPNISSKAIESIELLLPSDVKILEPLLSNWDTLHKRKVANLTENITLTTLRDSLLPKLISGEVRVKDIEQEISKVL